MCTVFSVILFLIKSYFRDFMNFAKLWNAVEMISYVTVLFSPGQLCVSYDTYFWGLRCRFMEGDIFGLTQEWRLRPTTSWPCFPGVSSTWRGQGTATTVTLTPAMAQVCQMSMTVNKMYNVMYFKFLNINVMSPSLFEKEEKNLCNSSGCCFVKKSLCYVVFFCISLIYN